MKTIRLRPDQLPNHYHFQFFTEVKDLTTAHPEIATKLNPEWTDLLRLYADEDTALEKIRKSNHTEAKEAADQERDRLFAGMVSTVKGATKHFNEATIAAAKRIQIVLDEYGNLATKGIKEQTSATYNLLQELQKPERMADIELIRLKDWINALTQRNEAVKTLEDTQYDEATAKTLLQVKQVRQEIDKTYRAMVRRLDALMLIEGAAPYTEYQRQLNERITKYKNIIAQRAGQSQPPTDGGGGAQG